MRRIHLFIIFSFLIACSSANKQDDVEAYINHGSEYYNKGDLDRAISDYDQAIQIDPNYAQAYNNRGGAYADKGETKTAIAEFNKALEVCDTDVAQCLTAQQWLQKLGGK